MVLTVRQELRVDVTLNIGAVQQEVRVTGDSVSAIETDSPTISGTFTTDDANNLPVNTRASFSATSGDSPNLSIKRFWATQARHPPFGIESACGFRAGVSTRYFVCANG